MLWTISMILFVLWALGLYSGGTIGSWVHLLLLFSFVAFFLGLMASARRPLVAAVRKNRF